MKNLLTILNSTIFMVLFCLSDAFSLPLTRTSYTPPEYKIDISLREEFISLDEVYRKDVFSFNLGMPANTSVGFDLSLINYDTFSTKDSKPGDIFINFWHFFGDFCNGTVDAGISIVFSIPTGPDAYTDEKSRNLSFGNNELKISPVLSFDITDHEILVFNISYIFREGRSENLYSGFHINPLKRETYKSCLGFNPDYEDSFLDGDRLENDYASIAAGLITSRLYPWVFFTEIYYSSGFPGRDDFQNKINIEGDNINPLFVSAGVKYFFSGSFYIQVSDVFNLFRDEDFIKNTMEFSMNIFF